jgi:hypothetical protein
MSAHAMAFEIDWTPPTEFKLMHYYMAPSDSGRYSHYHTYCSSENMVYDAYTLIDAVQDHSNGV